MEEVRVHQCFPSEGTKENSKPKMRSAIKKKAFFFFQTSDIRSVFHKNTNNQSHPIITIYHHAMTLKSLSILLVAAVARSTNNLSCNAFFTPTVHRAVERAVLFGSRLDHVADCATENIECNVEEMTAMIEGTYSCMFA